MTHISVYYYIECAEDGHSVIALGRCRNLMGGRMGSEDESCYSAGCILSCNDEGERDRDGIV